MKYGLYNIHTCINEIDINQADLIYEYRRKCINSVAVTVGIISNMNRSKLIDFNKIVIIDHRGFLINLALKYALKRIP